MYSVKSGGSRSSRRSGKSSTSSRVMFNELQRGELKRVLAKKYKKKYKNQEGVWIDQQISRFIDANDDLTSVKLKELEKCIAQGKDPLQQNQKNPDQLSNQSGISRMSGATDFDKFEDKNRKVKSKQQVELEEKRRRKQEIEDAKRNRPSVKFQFVKEEDEWAAIARYNKYLFDKRALEKRDNTFKCRHQMYDDLTEQVKIKDDVKKDCKVEDALYHEQVLQQLQRMKQREEDEQQEYHRIRMEEKHQRDIQMQRRLVNRRHSKKKSQAIDAFIVQSIGEEQRKEKELNVARKQKEKTIWRNILEQNEIKRQQQSAYKEKERLEQIAMQQAYTALVEQQERKREESFKARERKLQEFSDMNAQLFGEIQEAQDQRLNKKMLRYQARRERQIKEREHAEAVQKEENKVVLKTFLFKQMAEKERREAQEKADNYEQADIWKQEKLEFEAYENNKAVRRKGAYMKFASQLQEQISENKQKAYHQKFIMNAEENLLNKQLLNDIQSLSVQGTGLH